ncbi:MAG: shikimate kinase [Candidatus Omnitrophica bacterium]|nr:shikimate kinase [Candidatus Omnitrophota bacterium]
MNIVLIGYSGTGKRCVGRLLAERLGRRFVDTNQVLEQEGNDRLARLVQVKGQDYVDDLEERVVQALSSQDGLVIATGSRTLLRGKNLENLRKNGVLICLTAEPGIILLRTCSPVGQKAILLKSKEAIQVIREVMKQRGCFYGQTDYTIDTSALSPEEVAEEVIRFLAKKSE